MSISANVQGFRVHNYDALKTLSDKELYNLRIKYKRTINEMNARNENTMAYEVEFCYIDRELQLRERYSNRYSRKSS
jgi:hypothetical protein